MNIVQDDWPPSDKKLETNPPEVNFLADCEVLTAPVYNQFVARRLPEKYLSLGLLRKGDCSREYKSGLLMNSCEKNERLKDLFKHAVKCFAFVLLTTQILAFHSQIYARQSEQFPADSYMRKKVSFWVQIFSKYTSQQAVIHDRNYPWLIVDVIDFDEFARRFQGGRAYTKKAKAQIVTKYMNRYELAQKRLKKEGEKAIRYGSIEKRLWSVYSNSDHSKKLLLSGGATLRSQSGLSDEFAIASKRAERYLPYMRAIFAHFGLPSDLINIAFVESMFNEQALSKVGASGIWQFMPATARRFMVVNRHIDERNSPLKATVGAALLLRLNYKKLGSWPLAITAYNHGAAGMTRATRAVGSENLSEIIEHYQAPTFGFASRNFYAEFLAAREVFNSNYADRVRFKPDPLSISHLRLNRPISVHQLVNFTPLDEQTLRNYNSCLKDEAFRSYRYRPLPEDFEIIVPKHLHSKVQRALRDIVVSGNKREGYRS